MGSTLVDFDRTIISTRKDTVVETNVSPFGLHQRLDADEADEAQRAKRSSQPLSLSSKDNHFTQKASESSE